MRPKNTEKDQLKAQPIFVGGAGRGYLQTKIHSVTLSY